MKRLQTVPNAVEVKVPIQISALFINIVSLHISHLTSVREFQVCFHLKQTMMQLILTIYSTKCVKLNGRILQLVKNHEIKKTKIKKSKELLR